MKTKPELQKEVDDLERQIAQSTKRRDDLRAERDELDAKIKKQKQTAIESRIAGRSTMTESKALISDGTELEVMNEALDEANFRLKDSNSKLNDARRAVVKFDYDHAGDEFCGLFLDNLDSLHAVIANLKLIPEKCTEINRIGAPAGLNIDHDDHLRYVQIICMGLMGDFNTADGLPYKLNDIEKSYSNILARARERAKR